MLEKRNFYINGKWVAPSKPNDFKVINPSNEQPFAIISLGGVADVKSLDIADVEAVNKVADDILERHGRIDILVNSAGLNKPNRRWRDITDESWGTIIDVNLNGAFNVSHAAVKVMRKQRDGLIINVSSMASQRVGGVSGIAYTAAKTALNTMNESINHENCHLHHNNQYFNF